MRTKFLKHFAAFGLLFAVYGCANPINEYTASKYLKMGNSTENLDIAAESYRRALINTQIGGFSESELAESATYSLGKTYRRLGRYDEAETLLRKALAMQQKLDPQDFLRITNAQSELARVRYVKGDYAEAAGLMQQVLDKLDEKYPAGIRSPFLSDFLQAYSDSLRKLGRHQEADAVFARLRKYHGGENPSYDEGVLVEPIPIGYEPCGLARVAGKIWVAQKYRNAIAVLSAESGKPDDTLIPAGKKPVDLAVSGNDVWVVNMGDGTVSRFDAKSRQTIATIQVGRNPVSVAINGDSIWVSNAGDGSVSRISAATNQVVATIPTAAGSSAIVYGDNAIWVGNYGSSSISRIDVKSNEVTRIPFGQFPVGIVFAENSVWVANEKENLVSRIDPQSRKVTATIPVGNRPTSLSAGDGYLWVSTWNGGTIERIDPKTNGVSGKPIFIGGGLQGLLYENGRLWVSNPMTDAVVRVAKR